MKYNVKRHAVVQPQDQSIRLIPLTKGKNTVVDAFVYDWLTQWNWAFTFSKKDGKGYASRTVRINGKEKHIYMHKELLYSSKEVDHEDGDGLNNRYSNLRRSTHAQNSMNRAKQSNNKYKYKGAYPNHNNWMARICVNKRDIYLGTFLTQEAAALAYDTAALKYFGKFAHLNFPCS